MLFVLPQVAILKALLFYLAIYSIANIAAFMSIAYIENNFAITDIRAYKGLGKKLPLIGVSFVIVLVSLTGLPPTAGFIAKFLVFSALINLVSSSVFITILLIVAGLTTVISLFYYLKIPLNFFLKKSDAPINESKNSNFLILSVFLLAGLTLLLGLFPSLLNAFIN